MRNKYSILNATLLSVSLLLAIVLLMDWPTLLPLNIASNGNTSKVSTLAENDLSREFLMHQYDTAVKEIQARNSQEHYLFALKFSLVGSILALLFASYIKSDNNKNKEYDETINNSVWITISGSPVAAGICWAAVIASAIVDTRILYNASFIQELGGWINSVVEPALLSNNLLGWENYLNSGDLIGSKTYVFLRLNTNILTLVLFSSIYLIFFQKKSGSVSQNNWRHIQTISCISTSIAFIIFGIVGMHFCCRIPKGIYYSIALVLLGISITVLRWQLLKRMGNNQ